MEEEQNQIEDTNFDEQLKIILLGEIFTGKSSLINAYIKNQFNAQEPSTVSPTNYAKKVHIKNKTILANVWDTAGQEHFRSMNKIFIKNSNIVLFVYDITRKTTLKELSFWVEYTDNIIGKENALFGVIGNKIDLFDKEKELKEKNNDIEMVSTLEGQEFAKSIGATFLETSAKENAPGLHEFIDNLIKEYCDKFLFEQKSEPILLNANQSQTKKKSCC